MSKILQVEGGSLKFNHNNMNCGMVIMGHLQYTNRCKTNHVDRNIMYRKLLRKLKAGDVLGGSWSNTSYGCIQLSDCKYGEYNWDNRNYNDDIKEVPSIYEMMREHGKDILGDQLVEIGPAYNPNSGHPIYMWTITTDVGIANDEMIAEWENE